VSLKVGFFVLFGECVVRGIMRDPDGAVKFIFLEGSKLCNAAVAGSIGDLGGTVRGWILHESGW